MLFNLIIINNIKHKLQINSRITQWKRCNTILLYQHVILHQFTVFITIRPILLLWKKGNSHEHFESVTCSLCHDQLLQPQVMKPLNIIKLIIQKEILTCSQQGLKFTFFHHRPGNVLKNIQNRPESSRIFPINIFYIFSRYLGLLII